MSETAGSPGGAHRRGGGRATDRRAGTRDSDTADGSVDSPGPARHEGDDEEPLEPTMLQRAYARAAIPDDLGRWAPRVVGLCVVATAGALGSSFLPWVHAQLNDRGAALLVVDVHGTDTRLTGRWAVALAAVALYAAGSLLLRPLDRLLPVAVAVLNAGVVIAALIGRDHTGAIIRQVSNLRTGTIDDLHPTATGGVSYGLWLTIAAACVAAAAALAWLRVVAIYERRHPPIVDGSHLY
jgi:hypothetical protein